MIALRERGIAAHHCSATTIEDILTTAADRHEPGLVLWTSISDATGRGRLINGGDAVGSHSPSAGRSGDQWWLRPGQPAAAIAAGAVGHMHKTAPFETLVVSVLKAAVGHRVMSESERRSWLELNHQNRAASQVRSQLLNRLTARELDVLGLLTEGHRAVTIAEELVLSLATVRSHIRSS